VTTFHTARCRNSSWKTTSKKLHPESRYFTAIGTSSMKQTCCSSQQALLMSFRGYQHFWLKTPKKMFWRFFSAIFGDYINFHYNYYHNINAKLFAQECIAKSVNDSVWSRPAANRWEMVPICHGVQKENSEYLRNATQSRSTSLLRHHYVITI